MSTSRVCSIWDSPPTPQTWPCDSVVLGFCILRGKGGISPGHHRVATKTADSLVRSCLGAVVFFPHPFTVCHQEAAPGLPQQVEDRTCQIPHDPPEGSLKVPGGKPAFHPNVHLPKSCSSGTQLFLAINQQAERAASSKSVDPALLPGGADRPIQPSPLVGARNGLQLEAQSQDLLHRGFQAPRLCTQQRPRTQAFRTGKKFNRLTKTNSIQWENQHNTAKVTLRRAKPL